MPAPTEQEIAKKKRDYEKLLKKLDDHGRMRENLAISSLRSAIRKEWMRNPTKLAVLYEAMEPDMNPNTRTKWLYRCAICGELFKLADVEVDHISGEHSLKGPEDFEGFWENILLVPKTGLQALCKNDHATKTYQQRYNLSWDEAVARKKVIQKMDQSAAVQKKELQEYGYSGKSVANAEAREKCYLELLEKGEI